MFVERLKEEVYDVIQRKRVLVLVSMDVDAICACKILQWLFRCDNVQYTVIPVSGREELGATYAEHAEQIKYVFLINCGGNFNILDYLQPEEDVLFFIADSHRPLDLDNIYNQDQVKILVKEGEFSKGEIPEFNEIYEMSEDEDSENEGPEPPSKRRRKFGSDADDGDDDDDDGDDEDNNESSENNEISTLTKRNSKRKWEQTRQKILYGYYEYAFYGTSAAIIMYELAWKMSKDSNDLLWWAAVGLTDQFIHERIDSHKYATDAESLHEHVLRHNHGAEDNGLSINCIRISFDHELRLALYRHWSFLDSICYSSYTTCRFRIWTMKGNKRLHEFLADMGIPLVQSKQKFSNMDVEVRNNLKEWVQTSAEKFKLDEITYGSFQIQYGFRNKMCASDVVYAVNALLEAPEADKLGSDKFLEALDSLSRSNTDKLFAGIELAKKQLIALAKQVQSLIDMHQVIGAGPFLYAHLKEGTPDMKMFSRPIVLTALARFVLNAYVCMSKNKRAATLPFVLDAPLDPDKGTCLVVGVPPVADESKKNFLGRAFELTAGKTMARTKHNNFDPVVMEMKSEDRGKFFDALSALLV